jgi:HD-like signal output (HDOD) protein
MNRDALSHAIKSIDNLSTLPEVYTKIVQLADDPSTSAATMASIISRDGTLTAKLLRMANSPFYRTYPEKIVSITFAVALVGFRATKDLVLSVSIFDLFTDYENDFTSIVRGVWSHSITCAVASKIIAETVRYKNPEETFVNGLLHDIGKIVELQLMPAKFREIVALTTNEGIPLIEAESQVLSYTHEYTGKLLGKHWQLSPQICDCMELHHTPDQAREFETQIAIVHVANVLSHALTLDSPVPPLSDKACQKLQFRPDMIGPILRQLKKESANAISFLFPEK